MRFITVFTPTYNRAYTLHKLYGSLQRQTLRDFEWLIVDDGSTDHTKELVSQWQKEANFPIRYVFQENAGKMRAHNHGARIAESELFLCVDSDDYLTDDAIAKIHEAWTSRKGDFCGIIAYKEILLKDEARTRINKFPISGSSSLRHLYDSGYQGDTTLVFCTDILKKYPFPEIEGEKFVTEATAYDMIDLHHEYLLLEQPLMVCEYMPDGYTANDAKTRLRYPKGWALHYNQRARYFSPNLRKKLQNTMFYILFSRMAGTKDIYRQSSTKGLYYLIAWLFCMAKEGKYIRSLKQSCS